MRVGREVHVTHATYVRRARRLAVACALSLLLAIPVILSPGLRQPTVVTGLTGLGRAGPTAGTAAPPPEPPTAPVPTPAPVPRTGLAQAAVDAAEAAAAPRTELAVAVLDRTTGEVAVGDRGAEPYYTASLAKVVLAVDVLDRQRLDGLVVTDEDVALLRRALGPSDDSAMNALWGRFDGEGAAARVRERLGLDGTTAPRDPSQWGEMSVPAADFVRIWQYILDGVPADERDLLVSAMDAAPDRARDGFDQAFGLLSPEVRGPEGPGAVAKQGWMCCFSGRYYLHSSGAVGSDRRFLVALLTREPRGPGWAAARQGLDDIAIAAVQALD